MRVGVSALGFDVPAKATFRRDILYFADGVPHVLGTGSRGKRLLGSPAGYTPFAGQNQRGAQHAGIPGTKLVVHQAPKVTNPHGKSLSRGAVPLRPAWSFRRLRPLSSAAISNTLWDLELLP